ncbi:hypothetical protein SteCoe_34892 [Stentor coeruleus]|uniref:Uncharacterized protein n=1 Tax=Stentor coeruleus TaxID=5963 RepID=A0A1R2ATI2_9CILI|nr:hypothetical protein SteCoe_34892 [Stentor coeruleus]
MGNCLNESKDKNKLASQNTINDLRNIRMEFETTGYSDIDSKFTPADEFSNSTIHIYSRIVDALNLFFYRTEAYLIQDFTIKDSLLLMLCSFSRAFGGKLDELDLQFSISPPYLIARSQNLPQHEAEIYLSWTDVVNNLQISLPDLNIGLMNKELVMSKSNEVTDIINEQLKYTSIDDENFQTLKNIADTNIKKTQNALKCFENTARFCKDIESDIKEFIVKINENMNKVIKTQIHAKQLKIKTQEKMIMSCWVDLNRTLKKTENKKILKESLLEKYSTKSANFIVDKILNLTFERE